MLYHWTNSLEYVQKFLDHKDIRNTIIYINIEHAIFDLGVDDEYVVKLTDRPEEIKLLLEMGFDFQLQQDNLVFLRKRK
jgi:hypothetical protein